jgi:hypothetical protein
MLTTGLWLGLLLTHGTPGAAPALKEGGFVLAAAESGPGVDTTPLGSLEGNGQLYFGVTQQEVVEQWRQRLEHLGLAATITWAGCISGGTPDHHAFYLMVAPAAEIRDRHNGIPMRVTLHWQEPGYAPTGWRLLRQMDAKEVKAQGK